jgi:CHAT domain-containing protein
MKLSELVKQLNVELEIPEEKNVEVTGFIPKARFDAVNNEAKNLKEQMEEMEKTVEDFKANAGDTKKLKEQIAEMEAKQKEIKENYEKKLLDVKKNSVIESELLKANAKYPELIMQKIDKDAIKINDDGIIGLKDQIENLKQNYKELFGEKNVNSQKPGGSPDVPKKSFKEMDSFERYELKQKNPELYKQLREEYKNQR